MTAATAPVNDPPGLDPAAFLRMVPRLLRCVPRESLVLVPIAGPHALGALRIDLPPDGGDPAEVAATAVGMVCRVAEVDGVAVGVYTGRPFRGERDEPACAALVERVADRAADCGLALRGAFLVAGDGWGAYGDVDAPRPRSEIDIPSDEVPDDQRAGVRLPRTGKSQRRRVAEALGELEASGPLSRRLKPDRQSDAGADAEAGAEAVGSAGAGAEVQTALPSMADLPDLLEDALSWDPADLHPAEAALIAFVFETPLLRDVALTQWSLDRDAGAATLAWQLEWRQAKLTGTELPPAPDGPLRLAGEGRRPDARRVRRGLELARRAASSAPRRALPGALASAAWLSWALGNSSHADEYTTRAHDIDARHGLASIMRSILDAHHLPAWVFSPSG